MDYSSFLDAMESYVDARIALAATDPDPVTQAALSRREEAEIQTKYARSQVESELWDLLNG